MIHRLALLMGGTGAAGVLALALALGGFGAPLSNSADAFAPVANDALGGGLLPAEAPTDQPTMTTSLGGGGPQETTKKVVDTVYVLPAPAAPVVHTSKPANDANQPADQPQDDNNGGNNNGDDQAGDDDHDEAGEDDHADDGGDDDHDEAGEDDGGHEPGDD